MDRFSPVAAAHIRVLVLPIGQIERKAYVTVLRRLQTEASVIRHSALSALVDGDDFALSPKRFEQGCLLFNYTSSAPDEHVLQCSPYELSRETLLVLGIASASPSNAIDEKHLSATAEHLREKHSRAVHRQVLLLHDSDDVENSSRSDIVVRRPLEEGSTSLQDAMNRVTVRFLRELTTYAQAMQASPSIPTPGQASRTLQRMSWLRDADGRPGSGSGFGTPLGSPTGEDVPSRSTSRSRASPTTSFDQIAGANTAPSALARSDSSSKKHNRTASQDRIAINGFGSGMSQEKIKKRGKARVGIVSGTIHMLAGLWSEALTLLVEHTTQVRSLHDPLWHAKGLENIIVCLMLHAWQAVDFQLPAICYPAVERNTSVPGAHRFSLGLPSGSSRSGDTADSASKRRLAGVLPDLVKQVIMLYRSNEGSTELDTLLLHEATVRLTKLLAVMSTNGGQFDQPILAQIVGDFQSNSSKQSSRSSSSNTATSNSATGSKVSVVELLSTALPNNDDGINTSDHLVILAGIASVYSTLGMQRKKAITMKELVIRLTAALNHARKLGAAEMGIHPAASLSAETGIVASPQESRSMHNMVTEIARVYGIDLVDPAYLRQSTEGESTNLPALSNPDFGSSPMKIATLKELLALCEAAPDPHGILRILASFLRLASPSAAVDLTTRTDSIELAPEEQSRLANMMSRTMGVARHLGLQDTQVEYWDPYMLRGLTFAPASMQRTLIDRQNLVRAATGTGSNPLLYDPNSSRQATAQQSTVLVQHETANCLVTLQNTLDVAIEIEWIQLVTDGAMLEVESKSVQLGAACLQHVALQVVPTSVGKAVVTACKIKVLGCREQDFSLVQGPWAPAKILLTKASQTAVGVGGSTGLTTSTVSLEGIASMPIIELKSTSLQEDTLRILEGESQRFEIIVRNTSVVDAAISEAVCTSICLRIVHTDETIGAGSTMILRAELIGEMNVSNLRVDVFYSRASGIDTYARLFSVPIHATVSATLQAQDLEIIPSATGDEAFDVSFTLANNQRSDITYTCAILHDSAWTDEPSSTVSSSQSHRTHLTLPQWNPTHVPDSSPADLLAQLLAHVRVTWILGARRGITSLTPLILPPSSLALLRGDPVMISLTQPAEALTPGTFANFILKLRNRTTAPSTALYIQLHPHMGSADSPVVVGSLTRLVPTLQAGEERVVEFSVCPLLGGELEVRASVRLARPGRLEKAVAGRESWSRAVRVVVR
nr:hypothetical protein B0A51_06128 [Rachicladosporium sp. CCFEE 5018]